MSKLILTRAAKYDVIEIFEWYELQTKSTGERFFQALDQKFESICLNPEIHSPVSKSGIRKSKLERWPYHVFFVFSGDIIEVLAIIHTSRDPAYISSRTAIHP
jgi:plasmid stabilization system protein ParE